MLFQTSMRWFCLVWLLAANSLCAQQLPQGFLVDSKAGQIKVAGISLEACHYGARWSRSRLQKDPSFGNANNVVSHTWKFREMVQPTEGAELALDHAILLPSGSETIQWEINASAPQPVTTEVLALSLELPTDLYAGGEIQIDGRTLTLPETSQAGSELLYSRPQPAATQLTIMTSQGKLIVQGDMGLTIQDHRAWKARKFSIRLLFKPSYGKLRSASLKCQMTYETYASQPVDFRSVANMAFQDERDGDGQGGWTDQGPENDLRSLKPGEHTYGGIRFQVIDPTSNGGKSAVMFRHYARPYFHDRVTVPAPAGTYRTLYALHSAAWVGTDGKVKPLGTIRVHFADGTWQEHSVQSQKELGDWWRPSSKPNGAVVWSAVNGATYIGLYMSRFPLENKPIKQIELIGSGQGVWGVVAMSLSDQDLALPDEKETPWVVTANEDWRPIPLELDVEPGSVLDLSSWGPAGPAGGQGHLVLRSDGKWAFERAMDKPVRFFGPNLCYGACFVSHENAEIMAGRLRRMGYNLIRLHHFEQALIDPQAGNSHTFDAEKLDRLDYLIHCLKRQGIYVTTDLYTNRSFYPQDSSLRRAFFREIKSLIPVDEQAMKAWERFAKAWLTHRNPYTGMTLADDPVLIALSPVNEDFLLSGWDLYPDVAAMYRQKYAQWIKQKGLPDHPGNTASPTFVRFLTEIITASHQHMQSYLRQLGVKALFSGDNSDLMVAGSFVRRQFQYVDNHYYHDHPAFAERPWQLPMIYHGESSIPQEGGALRHQFPIRLLGKPFSVTEFNYCIPNGYRSESGPMVGGYAAFQDWNMLCRFDWGGVDVSYFMEPGPPKGGFSMALDPVSLMAERMIACLFLRGDVQAARQQVVYQISPASVFRQGYSMAQHPTEYSRLGLLHGIGTQVSDGSPAEMASAGANVLALVGEGLPLSGPDSLAKFNVHGNMLQEMLQKGVLSAGRLDIQNRRYVSDTGQLELNAKAGTLIVRSDASEAIILTAAGSLKADRLAIDGSSGPGTFFLSSCQGENIASSRRLMMMHLTDVLSSQMKFRSSARRVVESWGTLPLLMKSATATVMIRIDRPEEMDVWSIGMNGKRQNKIDTRIDRGRLIWTISPSSPPCLAYELLRR